MTDLRQAAQQARQALETKGEHHSCVYAAITALRTALEQQAEPVAWDKPSDNFNDWWDSNYEDPANPFEKDSAAFWAWAGWKAAQRPWVGLTPEEVLDLFDLNNVYGSKWIEFARTVENKLKEKNA